MSSMQTVLNEVFERARASGVFGDCQVEGDRLSCEAKASAEPAFYRVEFEDGRLYVSLVTENRWLSESIESELMHSGDDLVELLDEELAELGYEGDTPSYEHYRSEDMLFTFRSEVPGSGGSFDAELVGTMLLGYEATFRQLGDMEDSGDDD